MKIRHWMLVLALAITIGPAAAFATEMLAVSEIRKGMKGHGLTVLEGSRVQQFEVEILGVLPNIGPGQNLILGRLVGSELLDHSGVIAGMSGSPIFVDGKLIGALAYSWQFSKDPIAGITPIAEMLEIQRNGGANRGSMAAATPVSTEQLVEALLDPQPGALDGMMRGLSRSSGFAAGAVPIAVPLSFGNFASETLERFGGMFEAGGFLPVPAGTSASAAAAVGDSADVRPFEPGDPVGAVLLDGDFSVAATGTVTHVDGDRVWAFGHPFLDMGEVDFPMAKSEVVTVLPSVARSFKFSNTGTIVGSFRQDRAPGILGYLGQQSEMIPVELELSGSRGTETYQFRLARHPMLSPLLLAMVTDSVVAVAQRAAGERTIMLESEIHVDGFAEPIRLREGWAGAEARQSIPVYLAVISSYLLSNEFTDAPIAKVALRLRHEDDLRVVRLLQASVEPPLDGTVNPGDTVRVRTLLKPFRGEAFTEEFELVIPENVQPGNAYVFVGSGSVANRLDFSLVPPDPQSLTQVVSTIERLRSSTDLTVALYARTDGAVSAGVYHPSLPPSMQAIVSGDTTNSSSTPVKVDAPVRMSKRLDYIISGAVRVDLQIRPTL